jgi:hypothetical protein
MQSNPKKAPSPGYIYVLSNPMYAYYGSYTYKIGRCKDLGKRLKAYVTPYPQPVVVVHYVQVQDSRVAEKLCFKHLAKYRLYPNREFFQCRVALVRKVLDKVALFVNSSSGKELVLPEMEPIEESTCTIV